jgi:hypothetical protein
MRTSYGAPLRGTEVFSPSRSESEKAALTVASNEAAQRDAAYLRALNPPTTPPPALPSFKQPALGKEFQSRLDALDEKIQGRGIAISHDRLLSLGKERFAQVLELDRAARSVQRVIGTRTDLTSWASVEFAFQQVNGFTTMVPKRKTAEIHTGAGLDREAAAKINGFADLWKCSQERATVRDIYAFHDAFARLVFGQSLLEQLSSDGRIRNSLFAGGDGAKVGYFNDWLGVLEGPHFAVTLVDSLGHLIAWLASEGTPPPQPAELANQWFSVRAPSPGQLKLCEALWHGFILGYKSWSLWDFVGRRTRQQLGLTLLEQWRMELSRRYPAITAFHGELTSAFLRPVSSAGYGHYQFDEAAYRTCIGQIVQRLSNRLSGLTALALDEILPGAIVARFENWLLCEGAKAKGKGNDAKFSAVSAKLGGCLNAAFRSHASFPFTVKEVL